MEKHSRTTTRTGHNNQEQDPINADRIDPRILGHVSEAGTWEGTEKESSFEQMDQTSGEGNQGKIDDNRETKSDGTLA